MRLKPAASRSPVKHSTTEPPYHATDVSTRARGLKFGSSIHLNQSFVYASSEGSDESVQMNIPARAFAALAFSISIKFPCACPILLINLQQAIRASKIINKKRYDSELPYQRPELIEVMEIEIDLTTSTNVHTGFYISVRECLD